jgi:putative ABC transport system ATP-binding protein
MDNSLISVSNLTKIFEKDSEKIIALNNVTFDIPLASFVSITGPSGSGKSTLLYILGLLDSASSGTYSYKGLNISAYSDLERSTLRNQNFGFIFQSFHLISNTSALSNVCLPLEYSRGHGKPVSREDGITRAKEALDKVGLSSRLYHKPSELSGGQKQRVAIARALVNNPSIIIADEPTGNLDSKNTAEIMDIFSNLHQEGQTVILVTHNPELEKFANIHITLRDGKLLK